jgi:DNA-binding response OmpR family regulator
MNIASDVPRILIIEQDVALQGAIAMPLYEAGYITATTRHKDEALAVLIQEPYDAVILDPFQGGGMLELLQQLRNDDLLSYPRVVVVTSQSARARDALANGWADIAFDKDGIDWYILAQAVGDLLAGV